MNNFIEDLKKYFEVTPQNKIIEDWAKTEKFDQIGPTMDEFLIQANYHYNIQQENLTKGCCQNNIEFNPKFSSGFFFKNSKLCKKQLFQLSNINLTK